MLIQTDVIVTSLAGFLIGFVVLYWLFGGKK